MIYIPKKSHIILALLIFTTIFIVVRIPGAISQENGTEPAEQAPDAKDILTWNTPEQKLFTYRKFNFINGALDDFSSSSIADLSFDLRSQQEPLLYLTPEELQQIPPIGPDPFGPDFWKRFNDIPPTVPLNTALQSLIRSFRGQARRRPFARSIPIPTKTEIDILKVLWAKSEANSSDIYAELDSLIHLTSEDLQIVLANMVDRGFLDRKKISPSDEFNLFGIVSIEKSSKNRKNQLYLYWPRVNKASLIKFLDSERFLALATAGRTASLSGRKTTYQRSLEEKLYLLVQ
ncbi:MAG: BlaI/MecI/CopY family transcriptional regulator [bacterium]